MMKTKRFPIQSIRRQCIKAIKAKLLPLMHDSGYIRHERGNILDPSNPGRPLKLLVLKRMREPTAYFGIEYLEIFTEDGLGDGHAGGLATEAYESLCLEDLIRLRRFVEKLRPDEIK